MKVPKHIKIGIGAAGAFIFGLLIGWVIWPAVLKSQMKKEKSLAKKTDLRAIWERLPFALDFKIYVFNYTNPEEIQKGQTPIVKHIGPYHFEKWLEKVDIHDHEENDTVSFRKRETYYFRQDLSGPGLTGEEMVILPHPFLIAIEKAASQHPDMAPALEQSFDILFDNPSDIFLRTKVMDFLFRGLIINCSSTVYGVKLVCDYCKRKEVAKKIIFLPGDLLKVSAYGSQNGTVDAHVITVMRGIRNMKDVSRVVAVDGAPRLDIWHGRCNEFAGTDGVVFPPFVAETDKNTVYLSDYCRSFAAWYHGKSSYAGVKTNLYVFNFGDPINDPELQCYCETPDKCLKKGLVDLTKCLGLPVYISLPHFLESDPSLLEGIKGLNPDEKLHGTAIDFESISGSVMRFHQRFQINMPLERREGSKLFSQVPNFVAPLFWVQEAKGLNKTYVNMVRYPLFLAIRASQVMTGALVIGGVLGMIAASFYHFRDRIMGCAGLSRSTPVSRIKPQ